MGKKHLSKWLCFTTLALLAGISCAFQARSSFDVGLHNLGVPPCAEIGDRDPYKFPFSYWPGRTVYYYIYEKTFANAEQQQAILYGFRRIEDTTCIAFKKFDNFNSAQDYVVFAGHCPGECRSQIGRQGGVQYAYLGQNCTGSLRNILTILMKILGFDEENNRPDRDSYLKMAWNRIAEENRHFYLKNPFHESFGIDFDVYSVTLRNRFSLAVGAKAVMEMEYATRNDDFIHAQYLDRNMTSKMGVGADISIGDRFKIRAAYYCYGGDITVNRIIDGVDNQRKFNGEL